MAQTEDVVCSSTSYDVVANRFPMVGRSGIIALIATLLSAALR
jgi:hypothetical protein